jgi:hypothetical protein
MCYTRKEERDLEREARRFCEVRLVGFLGSSSDGLLERTLTTIASKLSV